MNSKPRNRARTFGLSLCVLAASSLAISPPARGQGTNISATKHNLSASGPGPIKIVGLTEVCTPCHTPHASNPIAPLWNRSDSGAYYQLYISPTRVSAPSQPSGTSRLCLSCHDGTVALGQTFNPRNRTGGSIYITSRSAGYIGTDLRDDHPISFVYDSALVIATGRLNDPAALPRQLPLDREKRLQCTTCHDPHDNTRGYFLNMDNHQSRMCVTCHNFKGWATSAHATANASVGAAAQSHWADLKASTVSDLACESCHRPHSAGGRQWLLYSEAEQDNCLPCHNGTVGKNVARQFTKPYRHDVTLNVGVHSPNENPSTMTMHVACGDCHNPHETFIGPTLAAPLIKPSMKGASGTDKSGLMVAVASFEYEVCYKCHGWQNPATPIVNRVISQPNVANDFDPGNAGYHPVVAQGKNMIVPSLLPPRHVTDQIYCTDCHGADAGTLGPHGSIYNPMLVRNYSVIDNTGEGPTTYALCYGCHDRNSILANASFPKHSLHISRLKAPCSICHDPHGVAANPHLINFDRDRVTAVNGVIQYTSTGARHGSCTLICHGVTHNPKTY